MGYSRWHFAIDSQNEVHPLKRAMMQDLHSADFSTPERVPMVDRHGYLIAEAEVRLSVGFPEQVERVHLYVLPANGAAVGEIATFRRGVVPALRMALRRKLARAFGGEAQASAEEALNELERRIAEGDVDLVYRTAYGRLEEGARRLSRG